MKFGYLDEACRKHDLSAPLGKKDSSSPKINEAVPCWLPEAVRMEAATAVAVSHRLRLNLG